MTVAVIRFVWKAGTRPPTRTVTLDTPPTEVGGFVLLRMSEAEAWGWAGLFLLGAYHGGNTYELLGEELLRAGRIEEATQAFEKALARTPGRRVTVAGAEAVTAASA